MSACKRLRVRMERAVQLGLQGQWTTLAERTLRKLSPLPERSDAQTDPVRYARWKHKQARRWAALKAEVALTLHTCVLPARGSKAALAQAWRAAKKADAWLLIALPHTTFAADIAAHIAAAIDADTVLVSFDHDERGKDGRPVSPFFKPAPSPLRLQHQAYVLPAFAFRAKALSRAPKNLHAIALQLANKGWKHHPVVLATAAVPGIADRRIAHSAPALRKNACVSILIPFRDQPALLDRCLETLFANTRGVRFEVWLLDNGSVETATKKRLAHWQKHCEYLRLDGPFNFSWLNNEGAARARGSHLLLLNNDTELIASDWLRTMLAFGCEASVGAVGARLLYPDGTLQHGGVALGVAGLAAHTLSGAPGDTSGHHGGALVPHELSAVTGACLLVERRKYWAVGGLDAVNFKVAFNDLDLCLRLARRGWRTVYTPDAVLLHHESKSRGSRVSVAEDRAFAEAWRPLHDPYLSPNFSRLSRDLRWK